MDAATSGAEPKVTAERRNQVTGGIRNGGTTDLEKGQTNKQKTSIAERTRVQLEAKENRLRQLRAKQIEKEKAECIPHSFSSSSSSRRKSKQHATFQNNKPRGQKRSPRAAHADTATTATSPSSSSLSSSALSSSQSGVAENLLAWQRNRDARIAQKREAKLRSEQEALREKPRLVNRRSEEILNAAKERNARDSGQCEARNAAEQQQQQQHRQDDNHIIDTDDDKAEERFGQVLAVGGALSVADRLIAQGKA